MQKIKCKTKTNIDPEKLRVKVIKAPLVNSEELKKILFWRQKAVVL